MLPDRAGGVAVNHSTRGLRLANVALVAGIWLVTLPAAAQVKWAPYVGVSYLYDTNLFRASDETRSEGFASGSERSDSITTYDAGLALSYALGQQQISVRGSASQARYDRNEQNDFEGYTSGADLAWTLGPALSGGVAYGKSRSLRDFETLMGANQRVLVDSTSLSANAGIAVGSQWRLGLNAGQSTTRNASASRRSDDREDVSAGVGLDYLGFGRWSVGVSVGGSRGEFPEREPVEGVSEEFEQIEYRVNTQWKPSGISSFSLGVGRSERTDDGLMESTFSATTGDFGYQRRISAKTGLSLAVTRSVSSNDQQGANFVVNTGGSLALSWAATQRLNAGLQLGLFEENYEETPSLDVEGTARVDLVRSGTLSLGYAATKWLALSSSAGYQKRTSNGTSAEFDATQISLSARLQLP